MKLREARKDAGYNQISFSAAAGINYYDYNKIERGRFLPTVAALRRICLTLGKKPLELYEAEELDLARCLKITPGGKRPDGHKQRRKMTFRIPDELARAAPADLWPTLGFESGNAAFVAWYAGCLEEYQKRKAPRRRGESGDEAEGK